MSHCPVQARRKHMMDTGEVIAESKTGSAGLECEFMIILVYVTKILYEALEVQYMVHSHSFLLPLALLALLALLHASNLHPGLR